MSISFLTAFPRSRVLSLSGLAACLVLSASTVQAANYYIDSVSGLDSNLGTAPEQPWKSLEKVNSITFQPGDRLLFKAGATWKGRLHPKGSGTTGQRIAIDRYGNGPRPAIQGGGIELGVVMLEDQQYWTICNLDVSNKGTSIPKKMGILVRNRSVGTLSGFEIRDCVIHDVTGDMEKYVDGKESGGIVFYITAGNLKTPSRWTDIRIENNKVLDVNRSGILLQSQWINKPNDPHAHWKGHGDYTVSTGIHIGGNRLERIGGDGIIPWCLKGAVVERNFVRQSNNNPFKQGHAAIWPYFCEDVIFQYNEVCETKTKWDGMAFDFDNNNNRCVYQYNYSHDNEGGFLNMCSDGMSDGNIARYNISQNDGCTERSRVFLVHGDGNRNYRIYNNTVYVHNGSPTMFEAGAASKKSSIDFQNNIFVNEGKGTFRALDGCRFEANLYFGCGEVTVDPKKILADPRLLAPGTGGKTLDSVAGYKLAPGSPALGAGVPVPGNGGSDYWGNPISKIAAPNIGAFNGRPVSQ